MKKFLKDLFTGPASEHYEMARVLFFTGFCVGIGAQVFAIAQGQEFDVRVYAESIGILLLAGGGATAVKDYGAGKAKQVTP